MCCPNCKGQLHPEERPDYKGEWYCEDCDWIGDYPRLNKDELDNMMERLKADLKQLADCFALKDR